jgi:uncharacterized membrane protein YccF (DUF307 family)
MVFFLMFFGSRVFAQEVTAASVAVQTKDNTTAINIMWMLLAGFLVFFMQAGLPWWKRDLPGPRTSRTP